MKHAKKIFVGAAIAALGMTAMSAQASTFLELRLLGKNLTKGDAGYSSTINADPGDHISLEIVSGLGTASGQINANGQGSPYTSGSAATDGVQNLKFNVYDKSGDGVTAALTPFTLQNGWNGGTGSSGGTLNAAPGNTGTDSATSSLDNIRGIQAPGVFVGNTTSGLSVVGVSSADVVVGQNTTGGFFGISGFNPQDINSSTIAQYHINGSATLRSATLTTEKTVDPLINTVGLTVLPAPEPASIGLLGIAAVGLMGRRRRQA